MSQTGAFWKGLIAAFSMTIVNLVAAASAPSGERAAHVESCAAKLAAAQMATPEARAYCECMIDGLEREFGADALTREVDPTAVESYVQRLLMVVNACAHLSPTTPSSRATHDSNALPSEARP